MRLIKRSSECYQRRQNVVYELQAREMVILGSQYAGEMKKGIFTVMHYLMPKRGILSLHSGCNVGKADDVSLFFGLSGKIVVLHGNLPCGFQTNVWCGCR